MPRALEPSSSVGVGVPAVDGTRQVYVHQPLRLQMITNRGAMVFPSNDRRVLLVDHFRCRFVLRDDAAKLGDSDIPSLLRAIGDQHRWMHVEKLQEFDGEPAFSKSQV